MSGLPRAIGALAAGDHPVEPWMRTLREERCALGPALGAALSSWAMRPPESDPRPPCPPADETFPFLEPPDAPDSIGRLGPIAC